MTRNEAYLTVVEGWLRDNRSIVFTEGAVDDLCDRIAVEIERLTTENWQLKQACGYPIPADKDTPQNPFKCGMCEARALENKP